MSSKQLITPVSPKNKTRRWALRNAFAMEQKGIIPPKKTPRPLGSGQKTPRRLPCNYLAQPKGTAKFSVPAPKSNPNLQIRVNYWSRELLLVAVRRIAATHHADRQQSNADNTKYELLHKISSSKFEHWKHASFLGSALSTSVL